MNPLLLTLCGALQLAVLYYQVPSAGPLAFGVGLLVIFAMFAFTRLRWDAHLDMILIMLAPGGLGMLLPLLFLPGPLCHSQQSASAFLWMSLGMLLFSAPLSWLKARCMQQARLDGHGVSVLLLDLAGMQAGMTLAHIPLSHLPIGDLRVAWLHHGIMLVGMLLGMLCSMVAAQVYLASPNRAWIAERRSAPRRNS